MPSAISKSPENTSITRIQDLSFVKKPKEKSIKSAVMKNANPSPNEYASIKFNASLPFITPSARIEARIGPAQGVQQALKLTPNKKGANADKNLFLGGVILHCK